MKKILIPSEFSPVSDNALEYALEFNKKVNAKILLFHSFFIPISATEIPIVIPTDLELKTEAIGLLNKLKTKYLKKYPQNHFSVEVHEGVPEFEIVDAAKKFKCDLIIMGTHGASGMRKFLIGSNTVSVIDKSVLPVIAVPEKAKINGLKKIVFASNYGSDDFKNVFELIDIARLFESEITLLHINENKMDRTMAFAELEGFCKQLKEESQYSKISFKLLEDLDVYIGLNNYLEEVKADMLAISMRNRSWVQKIFNSSITKKMIYHTHIPIIAFHTAID